MTHHEERLERPSPAGVAAAEVNRLRALAEMVAPTAEPAEVLAIRAALPVG